MRTALLAILVCLSTTGVATAEQFRGAPGDATNQGLAQDESQEKLRPNYKDEEEEMMKKKLGRGNIFRALGKRNHGGKSPRTLYQSTWDRWQRAGARGSSGDSSGGNSSNSGSNEVNVKTEKKRAQEAEYYKSWILRYRVWAKKWRKKQRKKTGKSETQYYESNSGIFKIKIPLFSSTIASGYDKNQKKLERDLKEAAQFKVKLFVQQSNKFEYEYPPGLPPVGPIPPPPAPTSGADPVSPNAGEVDDFETNTVEENVDEGDLLKVRYDGKYAFTAFGGNLIIWDVAKNNSTVSTMALPPIESKNDGPSLI